MEAEGSSNHQTANGEGSTVTDPTLATAKPPPIYLPPRISEERYQTAVPDLLDPTEGTYIIM